MFYINAETRGNSILLTYVDDEGETKYAKVNNYKPQLFIESNSMSGTHKELVSGKSLIAKSYNNIKSANDDIRQSRENEGSATLYGNRNFNLTFLHEQFTNMDTTYDMSKIRGFILDIECPAERGFPTPDKAEWPINLMCIYDTLTEKYYLWGENAFSVSDYTDKLLGEGVNPDDVVYYEIADERTRLQHMVNWWSKNYPSYITGWNTSGFDNPYIVNRLQRIGIDPAKLSPWGVVNVRDKEFQGRQILSVNILGIADLDYLLIYKNNSASKQESYKLGHIAHVELGKDKVDYSAVASDLRTLHKKDWGIYSVYNVVDVAIVKELEANNGYLSVIFAIAYTAGINYGTVSSPVGTWANILYRDQINNNVVLPPVKEHASASFEGGWVKPPNKGKHKWVVSIDLNSLYPHLIAGTNISPETITSTVVGGLTPDVILEGVKTGKRGFELPSGDVSVGAAGYTFTKEKEGVLGHIMMKLYGQRKSIKKEMIVHKQTVYKINVELAKRGLK